MTDLCSVPGCLHYVSLWKLVPDHGGGGPCTCYPPSMQGIPGAIHHPRCPARGPDRHYVGFCAAHAKLGPYEQRRLL